MTHEPTQKPKPKHKLLSEDPEYRETLLGPFLREVSENAAVWKPDELPQYPHRRSGRDCSSESRAARTKRPATMRVPIGDPTTGVVTEYDTEICRCGSHRQLINGEPSGRWEDINAARNNPTWFTRTDRDDHRDHGGRIGDPSPGGDPAYPVVPAAEQPVAQPSGTPRGRRGRAGFPPRTWP